MSLEAGRRLCCHCKAVRCTWKALGVSILARAEASSTIHLLSQMHWLGSAGLRWKALNTFQEPWNAPEVREDVLQKSAVLQVLIYMPIIIHSACGPARWRTGMLIPESSEDRAYVWICGNLTCQFQDIIGYLSSAQYLSETFKIVRIPS